MLQGFCFVLSMGLFEWCAVMFMNKQFSQIYSLSKVVIVHKGCDEAKLFFKYVESIQITLDNLSAEIDKFGEGGLPFPLYLPYCLFYLDDERVVNKGFPLIARWSKVHLGAKKLNI